MRRIMRTAALALTLGSVALVPACSEPPERADTVTASSSAPEPEAPEPEAPEPGAPEPGAPQAAGTLSQEQAEGVLLTVEDLPTGWTVESSGPASTEPETTTEPAECGALFAALDEVEPVAKAEASFSAGGLGPVLEQVVTSYDDPTTDQLEGAAAALGQCPAFTSVDETGERTELTASPLSFPNLGNRTLAVRMQGRAQGLEVVADVVCVAVGSNAVTLISAGLTPLPGADLERLATRAVARVGEVQGG